MIEADPSLALLRAIVAACEHDIDGQGSRQPILYVEWIGGESIQHPAEPPVWPRWDKAMLVELRGKGLINFDGTRITTTEVGRKVVAQHDRAMTTEPVADLTEVLAAVAAQASVSNPLAWPAVRPFLAALRVYWQAGGFSEHGVQLIAVLHALPDEHEPVFRATVLSLVKGDYLEATSSLAANSIPLEVGLTEKAHSMVDGWPGAAPDELVENLIAVLTATAQAEPDEQRKGKLQGMIALLKEIGVATASEVLSKAMLGR